MSFKLSLALSLRLWYFAKKYSIEKKTKSQQVEPSKTSCHKLFYVKPLRELDVGYKSQVVVLCS